MPERFTPEELEQLINTGELTAQDLKLLDPNDAKVALPLLVRRDTGGFEVGTPILPPAAVGAISSAPSIISAIGRAFGIGGGSGIAGGRPSTGPAPGQRRAPVMGSRVYGPKDSPSRPPAPPREPSNLERHGNVTRPGPDAQKGGGGPSRVNRSTDLPDNPLDRSETLKGPTGNPDNYRTISKSDRPAKSVGAEVNKGDRRSASRNSEMYEAMKAGLPEPAGARKIAAVKNASRQSPTAGFDETDKRKVEFGGLNASSTGYRRPQDRKPLSKREIDQLIENVLRLVK